jgi:hemerythrin-like domain-containing protein
MPAHFNSTAPDFEHPLEMLVACHDRIEAQCETLKRLAAHLPASGCDEQAREAAAAVMRYFDTAGQHHQDDEEHDLFPRVLAAARGENTQRIALLIGKLQREHGEIERAWREIRARLEKITRGEPAPLDELTANLFAALHRAHIAIEEANLFPLAAMLLDAAQMAELGRCMARRRGHPG